MNVSSLLSKAATTHPDRVALRWGAVSLSYQELDRRVSEFVEALAETGLGRGDRVAVFMGNNIEYVVGLMGTFRAGAVLVPVNAKLGTDELVYILQDSGAGLLLTGEAHAEVAGEAAQRAGVANLIQVGGEVTGSAKKWDDFIALAEGKALASDRDVDPTDLAWMFYTSGTTGQPKGAQLSHRNLLSMTMSTLADVYRFGADDKVLHCAPLSHGSGLYLLASLAGSSVNIIYDRPSFDPVDVLALIEREQITSIAFVAPTMIVMMLAAESDADTSSLKSVIYGGGPIHLDHAQSMLKRFGKVFVQIYGQGEAPMTITCLSAADHLPEDPDSLVSAGYVRTNVEVAIFDDSGQRLAPGESGEVAVRGDVVMSGYLNRPEANEKSLRDGWLFTGDVGRFDEKGRLHLMDRTNDMIISGGTNIYPREVEEALLQHAMVRETVVWGVEDELWGERVVAAVVLDDAGEPPTAEELIEFCKLHIASFKKPSEIQFLDELPKNAYGKVLRRELRDAMKT